MSTSRISKVLYTNKEYPLYCVLSDIVLFVNVFLYALITRTRYENHEYRSHMFIREPFIPRSGGLPKIEYPLTN